MEVTAESGTALLLLSYEGDHGRVVKPSHGLSLMLLLFVGDDYTIIQWCVIFVERQNVS